ncbi:hypothetical protein HanIR_Chr06g0274301 [Helianthus annuus]|nr:hypothetical protein HanIR_Chr06g0274301 [Helianthus annuus]
MVWGFGWWTWFAWLVAGQEGKGIDEARVCEYDLIGYLVYNKFSELCWLGRFRIKENQQ